METKGFYSKKIKDNFEELTSLACAVLSLLELFFAETIWYPCYKTFLIHDYPSK